MIRKVLLCSLFLIFNVITWAEKIKKEFNVDPGKKLHVDIETGGSIIITGWDQNSAHVSVDLGDRDCDGITYDIEQRSGNIYVDISPEWHDFNNHCDLDVKVQIPSKFDLDLETAGGDIRLSRITGDIQGKTMGGNLTLKELGGKLHLETMGGNIALTNSEVDGVVSTMGGNVTIEDVIGDVKGRTMGGNVRYDNVSGRAGKAHKTSTMGGNIDIKTAPNGADVHTMGGNIDITSAKKFVKAKTMGGNIDIDAIDGWVNVTTMGGDIAVTMVGNPHEGERDVEISSKGGDITLTLPPEIPAEFDIELAVTKHGSRNYTINSDFELLIEETDERDQSLFSGRAIKYLYGSGKVGTGRHKIKISTVNGDIRIRRGS